MKPGTGDALTTVAQRLSALSAGLKACATSRFEPVSLVSCLRAFVGFLIVGLTEMQGLSQTIAPPGPENGRRVFMTYYCYACHGTDGQGGAGPRLVMRATPDPLIRYVRKPTGIMPPYTSKVISEQDLRDIYAYLKSLPAAPAAKDIALLNR